MFPQDDPHTGGSLSDMAVTGTTLPNDAGKQSLIPSVPPPDQITNTVESQQPRCKRPGWGRRKSHRYQQNMFSSTSSLVHVPHHNVNQFAFTLPNWYINHTQTTKDKPRTDEILTGTGDTLPAEVGTERLHLGRNGAASKGDMRYDKYAKQKGSDQERGAGEGPGEDGFVDGVVRGRWEEIDKIICNHFACRPDRLHRLMSFERVRDINIITKGLTESSNADISAL